MPPCTLTSEWVLTLIKITDYGFLLRIFFALRKSLAFFVHFLRLDCLQAYSFSAKIFCLYFAQKTSNFRENFSLQILENRALEDYRNKSSLFFRRHVIKTKISVTHYLIFLYCLYQNLGGPFSPELTLDLDAVGDENHLSNDAALHKLAVAPKQKHPPSSPGIRSRVLGGDPSSPSPFSADVKTPGTPDSVSWTNVTTTTSIFDSLLSLTLHLISFSLFWSKSLRKFSCVMHV